MKGPKFRERNNFIWGKDKNIILEAVENHSKSGARKEKTHVSLLDEWIEEIRTIVNRNKYTGNKIIQYNCQTDPI